jgi:hypothetical protein
VKKDTRPIIGKVSPMRVQIYCGDTIPISGDTSELEYYRHHWRIVEVSAKHDVSKSNVNTSQIDLMPTLDTIKAVEKKMFDLSEYVKEKKYWSDERYLVKEITKGDIDLPKKLGLDSLVYHLVDDLFLVSRSNCSQDQNTLLVHSVRQRRVIWSKDALKMCTIIPEEKAIFNYGYNTTAQLLDIYTGDVLNTFMFPGRGPVMHIIGPLCYYSSDDTGVLLDVCTGETRKLNPIKTQNYTLKPPGTVPFDLFLTFLKPTRMKYVHQEDDAICNELWNNEYAQV